MAKLDFDVDKIMAQVTKDALEAMKKKFTEDINRLAQPFGERPRITFTPKGKSSLDVKVDVKSDDLRAKIDDYLKKQK